MDLEQLASSTPGMTGADLANLVNEAALLAARRQQDAVSHRDLTDALEKVQLGTARNVVIPEAERRRTAYHEAGHALLGMLQPGADPVRKVSIVPRGRALGVTLSTPDTDRYGYDANYLRGRIVGALGGMAAEQEVFGVDHQRRRERSRERDAHRPVDGGTLGHVGAHRPAVGAAASKAIRAWPASPTTLLNAVDDEVRRITDECYADARRLLRENRAKLDAIVARAADAREPRRGRDLRGGRASPPGARGGAGMIEPGPA